MPQRQVLEDEISAGVFGKERRQLPQRDPALEDPWDGKTSCGPPILMMQAS